MTNSNIPANANQLQTSSALSTVGKIAKATGVALVAGGFFTGNPPIMSIGSLIGAAGTGLGFASQATSPQGFSLARAF